MKPLTYSLFAAALACGLASAVTTTAYTTPVGYETLPVSPGFNYLGLRLQQPVVDAGLIAATSSLSITLSDSPTLVGTTMYILEVKNANGVTQEFLGSSLSGAVLTTPAGLSALVTVGDSYKLRTAPTLASTFGISNSAGLDTGFFGPGGDIIYLANPSSPGGFDQYYYDNGYSSWANSSSGPVDGNAISWNYADAVVISATGAGLTALTVSGEVKTANTGYSLAANSFGYLSSISPVGATLSSAFDAAVPTLDQGFFGPGGDTIYVPNPIAPGGFDQYYYDSGYSSWANSSGPVTASSISLPSGVVIYNTGAAADIVNTPPSFYSSL